MQRYLKDLLKEYVNICDENALTYYVIGGTALGAVRHHGFIPWDDDIDVAMPRPDYERLCGANRDIVLPDRYVARDSRDLLFGSFDDTWIEIQHGDSEWDRKQPYLSIDIFPIDGTPNNHIIRVLHFAHTYLLFGLVKFKRISYIQRTEGMKNRESRPAAEKMLIRMGGIFNKLLAGVSEERLVDRFRKVSSKYDYMSSNVVGLFTGRYRQKDFFRKSVFEPGSFVDFCGLSVRAYQELTEYLIRLYGENYMELPPEESRERHGDLRIRLIRGGDAK